MAEINNSDSVALAIDLLKQNGFTVYPPGFEAHVLVEINDSEVVQVQANVATRCLVKDNWTDGMDYHDIVAIIDDGKDSYGGYFVYTPRVIVKAEGLICEQFEPSDTIGGAEPDRPLLYEYFKSINF